MIKNNLKIAYRVLAKDHIFTLINILGLSTGLAIALLIISYARFEFSYEQSNPMSDRLVRITMDYLNEGAVIDQDAETYAPLGPRIKKECAVVREYARAEPLDNSTVEIDGQFYSATGILAVDPSFLTLFGVQILKSGNKSLLQAPYQVILTEEQAKTFYGHEEVLGETMQLAGVDQVFEVVGVITDPPFNTHLKYNMLLSYTTLVAEEEGKEEKWNQNNMYTYLLLEESDQFSELKSYLKELDAKLIEEDKLEGEAVIPQLVKDIHLYSHKSYEPEPNGHASSIYILLFVAILVILIAIVNYINLSTAKSLDRAKEVGIRKVIGSTMGQLRWQFFSEAFLVNLGAIIFATLIMVFVLDPFNRIAGLPASFTFFDDSVFWISLAGILIISTFLSGIFPAVILSSFKPLSVLKGKFSHSTFGLGLRKGLVVFQFGITTFLLIQTLTVKKQLEFMQTLDLGVDIEQTIVVESPATEEYKQNFRRYKDQLEAQSRVQSVALSSCVPGLPTSRLGSTTGINLTGSDADHYYNFYVYFIDHDFVPTLDMTLLAGDNFMEESDNKDQVIVNEESIRLWEIPTPNEAIGKQIDFWGRNRTIVGVVKNFHQLSAKTAHIPLIFNYTNDWHELASIKTKAGDRSEHLVMVKDIYNKSFPNSPFKYYFLDEEFNKQYLADQRFQAVFRLLSGFAILIACLGLFGLVSFTISRRGKEIGIRKVLGANASQIIGLLSRDFVQLILISIVIAIPITYLLIRSWLLQYAYRIDISPWLFIAPALLVLGISLSTLLAKTYRFSLNHPATSMRDD